jgi:hypothetical protein
MCFWVLPFVQPGLWHTFTPSTLLLADSDIVGCLDSGRNDPIAAICCDAEMAVTGILNKATSYPGFPLTGLDEQGDKKCLSPSRAQDWLLHGMLG